MAAWVAEVVGVATWADSACSKACMAAGKGLSNPSLSGSSTEDEPDGLKGNPPAISPKPLLGLGAEGAAIAPMAKRAREM